MNLLVEEQNKEILELKSTVTDFKRKLTEIKVPAPETDTRPLTMIVTEGINTMQKIVAAQPKQFFMKNEFCFFLSGIKKNIIRSSFEGFYSGYFWLS